MISDREDQVLLSLKERYALGYMLLPELEKRIDLALAGKLETAMWDAA